MDEAPQYAEERLGGRADGRRKGAGRQRTGAQAVGDAELGGDIDQLRGRVAMNQAQQGGARLSARARRRAAIFWHDPCSLQP